MATLLVKTLDLCSWVLSFNAQEKHKIKCFQTGEDSKAKNPDIRFCIDRGSDCTTKKIQTGFLIIEPNFSLELHSSSPEKYHYFKPTDNKRWWRINSTDAKEAYKMGKIRDLISESYQFELSRLKLSSNIQMNSTTLQTLNQPENSGYEPNIEDFESAYRALTRVDECGSIDAILDQIEINLTKEGHSLKSNWRMIIEENIKIWLKG